MELADESGSKSELKVDFTFTPTAQAKEVSTAVVKEETKLEQT